MTNAAVCTHKAFQYLIFGSNLNGWWVLKNKNGITMTCFTSENPHPHFLKQEAYLGKKMEFAIEKHTCYNIYILKEVNK